MLCYGTGHVLAPSFRISNFPHDSVAVACSHLIITQDSSGHKKCRNLRSKSKTLHQSSKPTYQIILKAI
uniref:Uncharacterized protein n=1 Tax=Rhizophora mucronata TaxID=61149 RepID=A0A2P2JWQ2_RHIMU